MCSIACSFFHLNGSVVVVFVVRFVLVFDKLTILVSKIIAYRRTNGKKIGKCIKGYADMNEMNMYIGACVSDKDMQAIFMNTNDFRLYQTHVTIQPILLSIYISNALHAKPIGKWLFAKLEKNDSKQSRKDTIKNKQMLWQQVIKDNNSKRESKRLERTVAVTVAVASTASRNIIHI